MSELRIAFEHERAIILHGDSAQLGDVLEPNSIDAIVTDPPAGIAFMGRGWDGDKGGRGEWIAWLRDLMRPAFDALKPGGHALVWALPRTSHWTTTALEDCGFEIRDIVMHVFATGFPKSLDVSKAIDAELGATRPITGTGTSGQTAGMQQLGPSGIKGGEYDRRDEPATDEARAWDGFGTALKPNAEHWILCRKPFASSVARNVLAFGTGALNIDACRVGDPPAAVHSGAKGADGPGAGIYGASGKYTTEPNANGRWPSHIAFSHLEECADDACADGCAVRELDAQSGMSRDGVAVNRNREAGTMSSWFGTRPSQTGEDVGYGGFGGASRFFFTAKPYRDEKNAGLGHMPEVGGGEATGRVEGSIGTRNPRAGANRGGGARNVHPTVKPITLMRWLVRLVTPPGGVVLDPFAGSGTTGIAALDEGMSFVGCELGEDPRYVEILVGRIRNALGMPVSAEIDTEISTTNPVDPGY